MDKAEARRLAEQERNIVLQERIVRIVRGLKRSRHLRVQDAQRKAERAKLHAYRTAAATASRD